MIKANRKECRKKLAELIENKLTVESSLAGEVHEKPVQGFSSTPGVVVSSDGSNRPQLTFSGLANQYYFVIEVYVSLPTPDDTTYTRDTVADTSDDIEAGIAEAITENQVVADYWEALAYAGRSHVSNLEIDGTQYRFEQIFIEVS